ncbi:TetR/AcrR family transcriptional regulator [Nonomuraea terrae]|uniref:TetR/AcrR family transcriptional regulator n=1 Tax=Nonomuraea terrae TaxID=2530383 RepID=UPI0014050DE3|nr:TetR/AcrR family transcriptional regulator [Nonomuraea terrae]
MNKGDRISQGNVQAGAPKLRKDAERNRRRIIEATREVIAELGVHAPVDEIAKRAGVGVGTLYRRFPDRTELIETVFLERAQRYLDTAREALRHEDAWEGFRTYLERLCAMQAEDRVVTDVLTLNLPDSPRLVELRYRIHSTQNRLIRAAKQQGALRADFTPEDVVLLLVAHAAIVQSLGDEAPESSPRFLALALDALRPDGAAPLPSAPRPDRLVKAMQRPPVVVRRRPGGTP